MPRLPRKQPASESMLGSGVTVMQSNMPGSSTVLDGSAASIFLFDPRSVPGSGSSTSPKQGSATDPWTDTP